MHRSPANQNQSGAVVSIKSRGAQTALSAQEGDPDREGPEGQNPGPCRRTRKKHSGVLAARAGDLRAVHVSEASGGDRRAVWALSERILPLPL